MTYDPRLDAMTVDEISRELIAEFAPEELELFDDLAQEYHADPNPPQSSTRSGDDALGFGIDASLIAMSPAVLAAVTVCFDFLMDIASDALKEQGKVMVKEQVTKMFTKKHSGPVALSLSPDQLARAQKLAANEARRFGLEKDDAEQLADAIAGRLAMNR